MPNVGIGTTAPAGRLDIADGSTIALLIGADNAANTRTDSTNKSGRIAVPHYLSAQVPMALVMGQSLATTNIVEVGGGSTLMNAATNVRFWTAANNTTTMGTERMRIDNSGNVGIGTTAPGSTLDVAGGISLSSGSYLSLAGSATPSNTSIRRNAGIAGMEFRSGSVNVMNALDSGNVGIGTTAPSERLEVNGSVRATSFISSSDIRLKRDVASAGGLDIVTQLTGVDWIWKSTGQPDSGVIAQDVEKVLPNAVVTDPNTGMKAVKYNALFAPIIQSIKELYYRLVGVEAKVDRAVASLKAENQKLKADNQAKDKEMAELKARMDRIEKMLAPKKKR